MKLMIIIGLIVLVLLVSGCDSVKTVNKLDNCYKNVRSYNCTELLDCDVECHNLNANTHVRTCHSAFTNSIISKCSVKTK